MDRSTREQAVALVTGASSGIGRATAQALHQAGFITYATARRSEALAAIRALGVRTLPLDVTDDASIAAAIREVEREHGAVDVLVNNAGWGPFGPIETFPREDWRRLFETNVFGMARTLAAVLPAMRARGRGRVINIGSMGGEFTTPLAGAYHASKYAVEALTDALRVEVAPFGVQVVLIQPGPVDTPMAHAGAALASGDASPYAPAIRHLAAATGRALADGRGIETPERVAGVIVGAALARRPRARYKVGPVARLLPMLRRCLPISVWDAMQARQTGMRDIARVPSLPTS